MVYGILAANAYSPKFFCSILAVPIHRHTKEPAAADEAVLNKKICAFRVANCSLIRKTENLAGTWAQFWQLFWTQKLTRLSASLLAEILEYMMVTGVSRTDGWINKTALYLKPKEKLLTSCPGRHFFRVDLWKGAKGWQKYWVSDQQHPDVMIMSDILARKRQAHMDVCLGPSKGV